MAYDSALATKLAKEVRRDLKMMHRKNVSWCGMTRWFLWSAAARHGIAEIVDRAKAQWGNTKGVTVKQGHQRTLDVAWRRIFAD
jgi:hypothetical protein